MSVDSSTLRTELQWEWLETCFVAHRGAEKTVTRDSSCLKRLLKRVARFRSHFIHAPVHGVP